SRSSDAINLAVREAVPLYVENRVLEEVGFNISEALIDGENEFILQNLKELLQEAVKNQDEEMQSILENEISNLKRKK
ncbi:MAG TPA: bifunctional nuclease family protein, partial [Candidatus Onthomorpha intestinigallinarum]|nr:bifunctional nuclease family protein [Candidatus Onthomorpha intestinigallinarum]